MESIRVCFILFWEHFSIAFTDWNFWAQMMHVLKRTFSQIGLNLIAEALLQRVTGSLSPRRHPGQMSCQECTGCSLGKLPEASMCISHSQKQMQTMGGIPGICGAEHVCIQIFRWYLEICLSPFSHVNVFPSKVLRCSYVTFYFSTSMQTWIIWSSQL